MSFKLTKLYTLLTIFVVVVYCFVRDTKIEKQYCGDLRNRIIGARLQLDGKLPYFYKWQAKDGVKYYDPQNFDSLKVSNITASPFMHELLYPLAHLPQKTISFIWLICQYAILFSMLFLAIYSCSNKVDLIITALVSCCFLFTTWWLQHVANGQIYILIPFFLQLFITFLKSKRLLNLFAAGICALILVAVRPTLAFFFLPFLIFVITLKKQQVFTLFLAPLLFICFICSNKQQQALWQNYRQSISEQIKLHQYLNPATQKNSLSPNYRFWEGYDTLTIHANNLNPLKIKSYNGNLFAFYNSVFNEKVSVTALSIVSICLVLGALLIFFYISICKKIITISQIALWGIIIYAISEFLSPIHRHQYNAVIWLFPLLLMAKQYQNEHKYFYGCLLLSLFLSINAFTLIHLPNIAIEITIWITILSFLFAQLFTKHKDKYNYMYRN
ncbi:MAG: glycosyltransferase 87 family protein [Flavobacterium sp.]|nr:glycosyltransferase 87 family protein [Flavobacterium sp.]